MVANMRKNSLKNVESDYNKIVYKTLLDFFLHRNGTYCLNKPRVFVFCWCIEDIIYKKNPQNGKLPRYYTNCFLLNILKFLSILLALYTPS